MAAAARDFQKASVFEHVVESGQAVLRSELLALHLRKGGFIDRKHAEFGIEHFLVQLLVALVELLELGMALDQLVEFRLGLPFEHGIPPANMQTPRPVTARGVVGGTDRARGGSRLHGPPAACIAGGGRLVGDRLGHRSGSVARWLEKWPPGYPTLLLPTGTDKGRSAAHRMPPSRNRRGAPRRFSKVEK